MTSLNLVSSAAPPPLTASTAPVGAAKENERPLRPGHAAPQLPHKDGAEAARSSRQHGRHPPDDDDPSMDAAVDEQTPLLGESRPDHFAAGAVKPSAWRSLPRRIGSAVVGTVRVVFATVSAPCRYVIACFYDEQGAFSPLAPLVTIYRFCRHPRRKRKRAVAVPAEKSETVRFPQKRPKRPPSMASSGTAVASDSEMDEKVEAFDAQRSSPSDEPPPSRRSIRIKLHNDELLKRTRHSGSMSDAGRDDVKEAVAASLKSPPSPGGSLKLTRFPRAPAPPRPLIPRRQPSYKNVPSAVGPHQKTLIIDLDETLIHSHSKGGRFATGHMVEVRMQHSVGIGGAFIGPQIPILYYVHKRPHCDEFLKKVCLFGSCVLIELMRAGVEVV
jgi:CTD nuclear envelope phosphatase 1